MSGGFIGSDSPIYSPDTRPHSPPATGDYVLLNTDREYYVGVEEGSNRLVGSVKEGESGAPHFRFEFLESRSTHHYHIFFKDGAVVLENGHLHVRKGAEPTVFGLLQANGEDWIICEYTSNAVGGVPNVWLLEKALTGTPVTLVLDADVETVKGQHWRLRQAAE